MKKFRKILSFVSAAALVAVAPSALPSSALTTELNGFTQKEADASSIKPHIYVSSEIIPLEEAKESPTRVVYVDVDGADNAYCTTGFHIEYDSRLTIPSPSDDLPECYPGDAIAQLSYIARECASSDENMKCIFAATVGLEDIGRDGSMWAIRFLLPDDVSEGDVFPIDIVYNTDDATKCLFTNAQNDEEGKLMQAYTFTRGIYNSETNVFSAEKATDKGGNKVRNVDSCKNLAYISPSADGFIAIEDGESGGEQTTKPEKPFTFGGFSDEEIAQSPVKPLITLDSEVITVAEAKSNPTRKIYINVNGAEKRYASTGLHLYYDSRLLLPKNKVGRVDVRLGEAGDRLTGSVDIDNSVSADGMAGLFLATSGNQNKGSDGRLWEINFTLPDDVAEGNVFPLDIVYKENSKTADIFCTAIKEDGLLMNAFAFTRGIYNEETNCNFSAPVSDIAACKALAEIDRSFDGYIAIADGEKPEEEEIIYGDANGDNAVNIADATAIIQFIANGDKYGLTEKQKKSADVDGVSGVTPMDAYVIQQIESGKYTPADLPLKK